MFLAASVLSCVLTGVSLTVDEGGLSLEARIVGEPVERTSILFRRLVPEPGEDAEGLWRDLSQAHGDDGGVVAKVDAVRFNGADAEPMAFDANRE